MFWNYNYHPAIKFFNFLFYIYISWLPLSYVYSIPSTNEHFILARCTLHYSTMHFGYFSWIIRLCLMLWQNLFCKQHLRKPYQWMLYGWIFWLKAENLYLYKNKKNCKMYVYDVLMISQSCKKNSCWTCIWYTYMICMYCKLIQSFFLLCYM